MGLFDRIKKALSGEAEAKKEEAAPAEEKSKKVAEKTTEEVEEQATEKVEKTAEEPSKETEETTEQEESTTELENKEEQPAEQENEEEEKPAEEKPAESKDELYEKGLEKSSSSLGAKLNAFFANFRSVDEDFFDDLEEILIESDVGFETAEKLTDRLRHEAKLKNAKSKKQLQEVIVAGLIDIYEEGGSGKNEQLAYDENAHPNVYLFVGVNGAGKTTTIGKLAQRFKNEGKSVILAAADTFRAGAVEQLAAWGDQVGVPVVKGADQADPASVVYDACQKAIADKADYLLVDTAGRLQNKTNLMNELSKIQRTIKKVLPDQPAETLLVLDGSTGQNALLQAKEFNETTKLTGLVLTKLDGSSKGGVVLSIRSEMKLPVKLVGLGEKADQLADFDAALYAQGLFHDLLS
jgi:fused signal recognition particle receptor